MALNADLQILTQPGSTGQQTYSLAAGFDPKAVIVWATPQTANGTIAHYNFAFGFGTYRGSVVQQRFDVVRGTDAAVNADCAMGMDSNALLVLYSATTPTRDLEIDLVSMQGGATSQVVLDWTNLHTTASIRVFMLVLGGDDITDALAFDFVTGATTSKDVTVASGFGKPDLCFFGTGDGGGLTLPYEWSGHAYIGFGFAKQGEAGRHWNFMQVDGNTSSLCSIEQRSDRCMGANQAAASSASQHYLGRFDTTVANWPTDGFRVLFDNAPAWDSPVICLALKGDFQAATGSNTVPISGTPPVDQDNACGFAPKVGLVAHWNQPTGTAVVTTAADQSALGIGATDGTDEAWAGFGDDDALGTMDSNSMQTILKVLRMYNQGVGLQSEADGLFSGNNFRLSWNDIDTVAREYQWLALGDAAGATDFPLDAQPGSYSLAGNAAAPLADRTFTADLATYALTGASSVTAAGWAVSSDPGTYIMSAAAATVLAARLLPATPGAHTLTGVTADLATVGAFTLDAEPGAHTLTGFSAAPVAARLIVAVPGAYTVTGLPAVVVVGRAVNATAGAYLLTGIAAELVYVPAAGEFDLVASPGAYAVTGFAANPLAIRLIAALPGSLVITGTPAAGHAGRFINAASGAHTMNGAAAGLITTRVAVAMPGVYAFTGTATGLLISGAIVKADATAQDVQTAAVAVLDTIP